MADLTDMVPDKLRRMPDAEVRLAWLRLHQWFGAARQAGRAIEDFVNAARWVMAEMRRRGWDVDTRTELARLASKLGKAWVEARFAELPEELVVVKDVVSVVGSVVKGKEDPGDIDVLVRAPLTDDGAGFVVQAENLWLQVRNALDPDKRHGLHWIFNPQGAHGDYVPVYDLVLRRRPAFETVVVKGEKAATPAETFEVAETGLMEPTNPPLRLDLGCGDSKPDGYVGIDKEPFEGVDWVWDIERGGIPAYDGTVDEVRAVHFLEHCADPDFIMREIWRVLKPGGRLVFEVPSTKGEGAAAHPEHRSFWNKSSFAFWTNEDLLEGRPRFEVVELEEWGDPPRVYVSGVLRKPEGVEKALVDVEWLDPPEDADKARVGPGSRFTPAKPELAGLTEIFRIDKLWEWAKDRLPVAVEPKWNGLRVIVEKRGRRVRMWTEGRPSENLFERMPEGFRRALERIGGDWLADADLGIVKGGRRVPRPALMKLLGRRPEFEDGEYPVLTVFDLPYWNGHLGNRPFREREEKAREWAKEAGESRYVVKSPVRYARSREELVRAVRWAFGHDRSEGAVAKAADSPYPTGATDDWSKIKKVAELKVIVLDKKRVAGGGWNYRGGLEPSVGDDWENVRELDGKKYVDLGWSYNTRVEADVGDIITVKVLEIIPDDDKRRLVWLGAQVQDKDEGRETPYTTRQAIDIARRAGVLQKAAHPGEEGETNATRAARFWRENWQRMFPTSGRGRFVYHHHWRGLDEDETGLSDEELLRTDHSVHGDLRFSSRGDTLWGFTVFLGTTEENRRAGGDRLAALSGDAKLRGTFKLAQPRAWLNVGVRRPLVVEPGGVGSTSRKWSKFFAVDRGTYRVGVWNRHFVEVFLDGRRLKGRYIIQAMPAPGGRRVWLITKPRDQRPYAETHDLDDVVKSLKRDGHEFLVWARPGERPRLIDLRKADVEKGDGDVETVEKSYEVTFAKVDGDRQLVTGVVLEPDTVDAHGDVVSREEIEQAAHRFLVRSRLVGLQHRRRAPAEVVESYIAPRDFELGGGRVKEGSWVMTVHVKDADLWKAIKEGRYTGFSIGGTGVRVDAE